MRIALLPLDSRPPSWQFPLRIAQIAGDDLFSPPRELLGTLHRGADQPRLLEWLVREANQADAAVISWDALVYGGLVQSRAEGSPLNIRELTEALSSVDWQRCQGYLWLTVPRLGMTIATQQDWDLHKLIAEYFRIWGAAAAKPDSTKLAEQLKQLEEHIGSERLAQAWWLRRRNADLARDALQLAATLGFRSCHVAVEDNAPTGPHLDEVAELRKLALELTNDIRRDGREPPRFTLFDGTDECGSLLTARAILDERKAEPLPVRLTLFPSSPSPDQYLGLYESHSLEDGLLFLAKFLGFEYRAEGKVQWLVCFGKQPQPDVFASESGLAFNQYLLPSQLDGSEGLFVSDLATCNGGNTYLIKWLGEMAADRLRGVSAWNTNFNTLGTSAATIAVASLDDSDKSAVYQFLLERIADDYTYQTVVRRHLVHELKESGVNALDLSGLAPEAIASLETIATERGRGFTNSQFDLLTSLMSSQAVGVSSFSYTFPWQRLFECELHFGEPPAATDTARVSSGGNKPFAPTISDDVR